MKKALVFPGQGSQMVGMGKTLYDYSSTAREVFEEVDDALEINLSKIIFDGPQDDLTLTMNAQPALMAVSIAVLKVIHVDANVLLVDESSYLAGHSLGEYSALVASESISLSDAARLLRTRGKAMQDAVPIGKGAMAALLGADLELVESLILKINKDSICVIANDNAPGQVVISGERESVREVINISSSEGVKKAIMLDVSAPFHSPLMQPASKIMETALSKIAISPPASPILFNVTADSETNTENIKNLLVQQVTKRVRWREIVERMSDEKVEFVMELGAGKVLSGLAKRIDRNIDTISLSNPNDIDILLKKI